MSKADELKKEAEKYAEQCYGWCNNDQVTDVAIATYIVSAEPREKRIEELEQDLDYQKQARTIAENVVVDLQKENAELKSEKGCETCTKFDEVKLTKAKEIIQNILRVTWGEGWNYSLDWKVKAEQFLKEE